MEVLIGKMSMLERFGSESWAERWGYSIKRSDELRSRVVSVMSIWLRSSGSGKCWLQICPAARMFENSASRTDHFACDTRLWCLT